MKQIQIKHADCDLTGHNISKYSQIITHIREHTKGGEYRPFSGVIHALNVIIDRRGAYTETNTAHVEFQGIRLNSDSGREWFAASDSLFIDKKPFTFRVKGIYRVPAHTGNLTIAADTAVVNLFTQPEITLSSSLIKGKISYSYMYDAEKKGVLNSICNLEDESNSNIKHFCCGFNAYPAFLRGSSTEV